MNDFPDWVLKQKKKGIEIRRFGDRYYACESSSKYDPLLKRARKITGKYLGVVTKDGIVKKSSVKGIRGDYEYVNIALIYGIAENTLLPILREAFPYTHMKILSYSILRLIDRYP